MKKFFLNNKGEGYVLICVFIMMVMMIFSAIFTYSAVITKINVMKSNTEIVFDSFVAENSIKIYSNIKQGSNAMEGIDDTDFQSLLKRFCTFEEKNGILYNYNADGEEQFHITVPEIEFNNGKQLELNVKYTMYIPISFAGAKITTACIPITVSSELQSKM